MEKSVAISVIMCSRDDGKFAQASQFYTRALAAVSHEVIRIADARSMCEGYNRGWRAARGGVVLFVHDDVEFLAKDFGECVIRHAERLDVFGVAGTTKLVAPAWNLAGPPYVYGQVAHDGGGKGMRVSIFGVPGRVIEGAQALDGIVIAARRSVFERLAFDERFDNFHLYDIDFSYSAHLLGMSVGIVCDLYPLHHGLGGYDSPEWRRGAEALVEKHPQLLPLLPQQVKWQHTLVFVKDRDEARRVMTAEQFGNEKGRPNGGTTLSAAD